MYRTSMIYNYNILLLLLELCCAVYSPGVVVKLNDTLSQRRLDVHAVDNRRRTRSVSKLMSDNGQLSSSSDWTAHWLKLYTKPAVSIIRVNCEVASGLCPLELGVENIIKVAPQFQ